MHNNIEDLIKHLKEQVEEFSNLNYQISQTESKIQKLINNTPQATDFDGLNCVVTEFAKKRNVSLLSSENQDILNAEMARYLGKDVSFENIRRKK